MSELRSCEISISYQNWIIRMDDLVFLIKIVLLMIDSVYCEQVVLIIND
jgi:hypothetical protein